MTDLLNQLRAELDAEEGNSTGVLPPAWGGAPPPTEPPADDVAVLPRSARRTSGMPSGPSPVEPSGPTSWVPVELGEVLDAIASGQDVGARPTMLTRSDGAALLYPGRSHALYGEPESGKTWIALHACAERLAAGETALYIDFEDTVASVTRRLLAVGADPDAIRKRFIYVSPVESVEVGSRDLGEALTREPTLTIIDGVTESLALEGMNLNDNSEIAVWNDRLPRRIARTGCAVLVLDHVTKDKENRGRWAIGGQHKLAGIDAAYTVRVVKPFSRDRDGLLALKLAKDRHGGVAGQGSGRQIAEIAVHTHADGLTLTIDPPSGDSSDGDGFRPTGLMERVSRVLEVAGDGLGKREIRDRTTGRNGYIDQALAVLVAEGYVRVEAESGGRGTQRHLLERRYRESEDKQDDDEQPAEATQGRWTPL